MKQPPKTKNSYKIGLVLDDTLDKPDGVQRYVISLGEWLVTQGHEVQYLASQTSRKDIGVVHSLAQPVSLRFNRNVVRIPLPASTRTIKQLLARENYDVLHIQMPYHPLFAAKVINAASNETAVVGTFHIAPFSGREAQATKMLSWLLMRSRRRFDKVISVSAPAQYLAKKAFNMDSIIIPNMVDIKSFDNDSIKTSPSNIVFLGRLVPRKGCRELLSAINALHMAHPSLQFKVTICGDGPQRASLESYISKHNLQKLVKFKGQVSQSELKKQLGHADIAVFPSLGGESFGIVLLEAMAAGSTVVLAGDNPGYTSVMGGIPDAMISPQNTQSFSDKLHEILHNKDLAAKIHRKQQTLVKQFNTPKVAKRILDVYNQAIAKR